MDNKFSTNSIHTHRPELPEGNSSLVSPIHQSVKYIPRNVSHLREILKDRHQGFLYNRVSNPTVRELEVLLAKLQGRDDAICVSTGISAIAVTVISLLKSGDHVLMFRESYKPTRFLQKNILAKLGVRTTVLGLDDHKQFEQIMKNDPPRLVLLESPTNPLVRVPDLQPILAACQRAKSVSILDNTFAGFSHHGDLPVDIFIHSLTKHANGHSDSMGGVIIANQDVIDSIWPTSITIGATLDPNSAWLILRGMKTYDLRTKAASANALKIAQWLSSQSSITNLRYPGLSTHPDNLIWIKQMKGDGGSVLSFDVKGSVETMEKFVDSLKLFSLTPSLGCVESLVAPCLCLFGDDLTAEDAKLAGISPSTVRLAVGIEDSDDLIFDLKQALESLQIKS